MYSKHALRGRVFAFGLALMALLAFGAPLVAEAQGGPRQMHVNQVDPRTWPDITVNLTLTGPDGKAVPDINASQFKIEEQNNPQTVLGLALGPSKDVPLAVVLAIDVSGSMNADNKLTQAKASASAFLSSFRPVDTASLVAFNDSVKVVVPATNNIGALQAAINGLQAGGNTAIYDALYQSAKLLNGEPATKRRAVILLTDGEDTSSKYDPNVAANVARGSGALVYTIGLGPDANDKILTDLATPSGGKYYKAPSADDLGAIYSAISTELNSQVFIRYKSTTQVQRRYELVHLTVTYTAPDGQVIRQTIAYRPPETAVAPTTPEAGISLAPVAPIEVGLPSGIAGGVQQPATLAPVEPGSLQTMSLTAAFLAGIALMLVFMGMSYLLAPSRTSARVAQYVAGPPIPTEEEEQPGFYSRIVAPALEELGRRLTRISPKGYTEHIEGLLTLTGPPYRLRLSTFLGVQLGIAVLSTLLLLIWALKTSPDAPAQWVLAIVLGLSIGLYFPYFWLKRRVTARRRALLKALPGVLDFLAINVEAGLGFDAALTQVVQRWHNTLTDECALLLIDFQIGKPRKDAWRDLVQRTQLPELTTFVTAMVQNEQVGASIGALLRTQAEQMRVRRRQHAEEAARTAPVKMLLPMVFFIFPGVFVVILGPAVPQFVNTFISFGH